MTKTSPRLIANTDTEITKLSSDEIVNIASSDIDTSQILQLQLWRKDTGVFLNSKTFDFPSYDEAIGLEFTMSIRNPNDFVWADIRNIHTKNDNSKFIAVPLIPPNGVIDAVIKIGKVTTFGDPLANNIPLSNMKDEIMGVVAWYKMEESNK